MSKILITGTSSGIGRALAKELILQKHIVWGVARRSKLLQSLKREVSISSSFSYSPLDMDKKNSWENETV